MATSSRRAASRASSAARETAGDLGILDELSKTRDELDRILLDLEQNGILSPRFDPSFAASVSGGTEALVGSLGRRQAAQAGRSVTEGAGGAFGLPTLRTAALTEEEALDRSLLQIAGIRNTGSQVAGQAAINQTQILANNRGRLAGLTADLGMARANALNRIFESIFGYETRPKKDFFDKFSQVGQTIGALNPVRINI